MQEDIVDRLDKALSTAGIYDTHTLALLTDARTNILYLRGVSGAISDGPSLSDLRKTTGC